MAVHIILHYLGEGGIYLMVCREFEGREKKRSRWVGYRYSVLTCHERKLSAYVLVRRQLIPERSVDW